MIKKLSVLLLSLSMLLAMAACGGDGDKDTSGSNAPSGNTSVSSEASSEASQETSSVETLGNTLTDDEITAIAAEIKKLNEAENYSMTMGVDVTYEMVGMEITMDMEMAMATKGSGDALETYSKTSLNMLGSTSDEITYFKDGKLYTMSIENDEVDGYYEEMTAEEFQASDDTEESEENAMESFEDIFSEDELKKAEVIREEGKRTIKCDSESDVIQAMSADFVEAMGYASDADDVTISQLDVSFTVDDANVIQELILAIACTSTMEEDGQTVEMAINMTLTMTDFAYGEAGDVSITPPEGLEDLPSLEDYLNDVLGEDWMDEDWLDEDWLDDAV